MPLEFPVLGVIGLGNIGGRIARRLARNGASIVGYDRDPTASRGSGVTCVSSVAGVAAETDAILLSLPDPAAIRDVVRGDAGLASVGRSGQVVIDLSTTDPSGSKDNAAALAKRGVQFMDASISGGPWGAESGELTIMVGADADVFETHRGLLEQIGSTVHHLGGVGAGNAMKLVNNFLNAVSLAATAEALVVAKASGLDVRQVLDVINGSSGRSFASERRFPNILDGDWMEGGLSSRLMMKDLALYLSFAAGAGAPAPNGPACLATFRMAESLELGDAVSNHVVDALNQIAADEDFLEGVR